MGIYDREYYPGRILGLRLVRRRLAGHARPSSSSTSSSFLLQNLLAAGISGTSPHGSPPRRTTPSTTSASHELLTAAFVHAGPGPLLVDMWFFWFIGRDMESIYGPATSWSSTSRSAVLTTLAGLLSPPRPSARTPRSIVGAPGADPGRR